ncbi:hypothetical protein LTR94_026842 [Friedmanniomyces endolithicus]|nr:hypothetical protein LTR94_026842 [Friedmanniomyces endolithicus]
MANDISKGVGNVFADLGVPDPADRQTKTRLAMAVNALLKSRRLKQTDAAVVLSIPQSKVSAPTNYRLDHFSVEKLISFLNALDQDVEIVIRPSRETVGHTSVHALT